MKIQIYLWLKKFIYVFNENTDLFYGCFLENRENFNDQLQILKLKND